MSSEDTVVRTLQTEAVAMARMSTGIKVVDADQYAEAAEVLRRIKHRQDVLKARRLEITSPAKKIIDAATSMFKPVESAFEDAEKALKSAMEVFVDTATATAAAAVKAAAAKGDHHGIALASKPVPTLPGIQLRSATSVIVENETQIPREFLVVDEAKVKAAAKAGVVVPGVRVETRTVIAASALED